MMPQKNEQDNPTRKIWVSEKELQSLIAILGEQLSNYPNDVMIRSLHDEVAVAKQRFKSATDHPIAVTKALGQEEGSTPLALNFTEASYLCSIAQVSSSIRSAIMRSLL